MVIWRYLKIYQESKFKKWGNEDDLNLFFEQAKFYEEWNNYSFAAGNGVF